mmetsp:Transcript_17172/g.31040  ORF Transcript_17172/g.31040 Transcript_17172/m.31040 type:complete len:408 (-) Transcript_17172:78-1301(-)
MFFTKIRFDSAPLSWEFAGINKICLGCAWFWVVVIFPPCRFWKTHQDTFNTSTSLEAKDSSTVIDKVELHITASPHELPLLLLLSIHIILMFLNNRAVGLDDRAKSFLAKLKDRVGVAVVLVIKENASKTTSLISMLDDKVAVGPSRELIVVVRVVFVAYFFVRAMEMLHIILVNITRSNISASPEPPDTAVGFKITVVEMHGGGHGVSWMHDTAEPTCKERNTLTRCHALGAVDSSFSSSRQGLLGHGTVDNTQVDSSLLKDLSALQDSRHTTTTVGANPAILLERSFAINIRDSLCNFNLSVTAHLLKFSTHRIVAIGPITLTNQTGRRIRHGFVGVPSKLDRGCVRSCFLSLISSWCGHGKLARRSSSPNCRKSTGHAETIGGRDNCRRSQNEAGTCDLHCSVL